MTERTIELRGNLSEETLEEVTDIPAEVPLHVLPILLHDRVRTLEKQVPSGDISGRVSIVVTEEEGEDPTYG